MHRTKQQLDLLDLFPAASTSTSAPVLVDAPSVAFVGQLPAATPLHLALNHLRREGEDELEDERLEGGLSERARGKQRAEADVFQGDEEVHSPGDDAQSRARQSTMTAQRRVLILTPDRDALRELLVEQCDGSLVGDRLDGSEQALLDRIDIRYLPTSSHLTYFLSTAYEADDFAAGDAYSATGEARAQDPSLLRYRPSLVILNAPSTYLREPAFAEAGVAALASLLAHFFTTFAKGSQCPPILAVFGDHASEIRMPLLPRHLQARRRDPSGQASLEDRDRYSALSVLEHFCAWTGQSTSIQEEPKRRRTLDSSSPVDYLHDTLHQ
ncbi:hypothetical protein JCM8115_000463 [Rhodotorula mucilaginosa]